MGDYEELVAKCYKNFKSECDCNCDICEIAIELESRWGGKE